MLPSSRHWVRSLLLQAGPAPRLEHTGRSRDPKGAGLVQADTVRIWSPGAQSMESMTSMSAILASEACSPRPSGFLCLNCTRAWLPTGSVVCQPPYQVESFPSSLLTHEAGPQCTALCTTTPAAKPVSHPATPRCPQGPTPSLFI